MRKETTCLPAAVHVVNNLFNHACTPNIIKTYAGRRCYGGMRRVRRCSPGRTQRPVAKGEELTATYGPRFGVQRTVERMATLRDGYGFECDCKACTDESYAKLETIAFDAFRCVLVVYR